jgi:hypothetical protein
MVNLAKLNLVSLSGRDQGLASLVTDLPPMPPEGYKPSYAGAYGGDFDQKDAPSSG